MDTAPLFDLPDLPVTPRPKRAGGGMPAKPTWNRYKPATPVKCDDCVALLVETKGAAPLSRMARWRRRHGTENRVLCHAHAQQWREEDGMKPLVLDDFS